MHYIPNIIGLTGTALCLIAYFLVNMGKVNARGWPFPLLNAFGSAFIIFSLFYAFNLSALVMESAWLAISLFSLGVYFIKM